LKPLKIHPAIAIFLIAISALAYGKLAYFLDRKNFVELILTFSALFLSYYFLLKSTIPLKKLVGLSVLFRLIFLFSEPVLSDDYYRFIWDGTLNLHGINPFLHLPKFYIESGNEISGLTPELFKLLNSPEYFTIYPPLCQLVYSLGALAPEGNYLASAVIMRICVLLAEISSIIYLQKVLKHFGSDSKNVLLYAMNPLIIVELVGNLHFEAFMICFLLMAIFYLLKEKNRTSALFFCLSVISKLLPLMLLPLLLRKLGWRKSLQYYVLVGLGILVSFLPFLSLEMLAHLSESVNLYFQRFEFNASFYYAIRWVGQEISGHNLIEYIGKILPLLVLLAIAILTFRGKTDWRNIIQKMMWAFAIYLFCATIVHPWYISTLVALCLFTNFRFPIVWSFLALFSYATYQTTAYIEDLSLVGLEYAILFGFLVWETPMKEGEKLEISKIWK
jgi:alpha-1,6-mannosyltransferase